MGAGLSAGGRSLGGRWNTVPDESGTNDRMNPVFRRFRKSLFIRIILCIPNLLRITGWISRFAQNDVWARVWGGGGEVWVVGGTLCQMNLAPTTG